MSEAEDKFMTTKDKLRTAVSDFWEACKNMEFDDPEDDFTEDIKDIIEEETGIDLD